MRRGYTFFVMNFGSCNKVIQCRDIHSYEHALGSSASSALACELAVLGHESVWTSGCPTLPARPRFLPCSLAQDREVEGLMRCSSGHDIVPNVEHLHRAPGRSTGAVEGLLGSAPQQKSQWHLSQGAKQIRNACLPTTCMQEDFGSHIHSPRKRGAAPARCRMPAPPTASRCAARPPTCGTSPPARAVPQR